MTDIPLMKIGKYMVIASIILIIILTVISFVPPRNPDPLTIVYAGKTAVDGWKVAQDYDCMGCHTIVGNGAYFAPDLTKVFEEHGPAWVRAFLDNPANFPTEGAVRRYLPSGMSLEEYYNKYPETREKVLEFGGKPTYMPFMQFSNDEKDALTAWLMYLSEINTNGWPPSPENSYSFSQSFEANIDRWPESFDAWVVYWFIAVAFTALILYSFFYWLSRGE